MRESVDCHAADSRVCRCGKFPTEGRPARTLRPCGAVSADLFCIMQAQTTDILICGGGIAGKAAALSLAQGGFDVMLLGARPAAALPAAGYGQRVYALNAASRQLLDALRVWPELPAGRIQRVDAMRVHADGAELGFTTADAPGDALAWIVESDAIEAALDLALRFERRARVVAAPATTIARSGGTAPWRIETADGDRIDTRLLVGADGQDSKVRDAAGIAVETRDYQQRGIVANFACARPHGGTAFQVFGGDGVIALLPLAPLAGTPMVSLVWSAPELLAQDLLALAPDALARRVTDLLPTLGAEPLGPLAAAGSAASWPLQRRLAGSAVGDGVVLVGDAAHRLHPLAGQGLNLGLQDVQMLARTLQQRRPGQPLDDPRLLRQYARSRAEQVLALATVTDGLARLYRARSYVPPGLRAWGLRLANAMPPVKQLLTRYASGLPYVA